MAPTGSSSDDLFRRFSFPGYLNSAKFSTAAGIMSALVTASATKLAITSTAWTLMRACEHETASGDHDNIESDIDTRSVRVPGSVASDIPTVSYAMAGKKIVEEHVAQEQAIMAGRQRQEEIKKRETAQQDFLEKRARDVIGQQMDIRKWKKPSKRSFINI